MSEIKKNGAESTITPQADIMSSNRDELRDELLELISEGTVRLILDLKKVNRIDSSGLSIFIATYNSLKNSEGVLELINVNENIKKLLTLTRLDRYVVIIGS